MKINKTYILVCLVLLGLLAYYMENNVIKSVFKCKDNVCTLEEYTRWNKSPTKKRIFMSKFVSFYIEYKNVWWKTANSDEYYVIAVKKK